MFVCFLIVSLFYFLFYCVLFHFHHCRYQEDRRRGNPTKSQRITTLIKAITKAEVQGKGKASEARSPFTDPEYRRIMRIIEGIGDIGKRLFCSALLRYQLSMGARVDDTSKLFKTNIKCNSEPALEQLSLTTKLCWSKNIATQKQGMYVIVCFVSSNYCCCLSLSFFHSVTDQILFGAGDVDYCVLLGLASFMEYSIEQGWNEFSDHLFCLDGLNCPTTIKDRVSRILSDVLDDPTFIEVLTDDDKKVGTHSIRKYAATYARRCGCSKDEVDYRFRWKNQRMQD